MNKIAKILLVLLCGPHWVACAERSDCVVADNIMVMESQEVSRAGAMLVLRTTGLGDKQTFVEFYESKVEFDECGKVATKPVVVEYLDLEMGLPTALEIDGLGITVQYSDRPFYDGWRAAIQVDYYGAPN